MKKIEATIPPFQVDDVKAVLDRLGVPGLTVGEVHAFDGDGVVPSTDDTDAMGATPRLKIEILLDDAAVGEAVASLARVIGKGAPEPPPLFVAPVEDVVRIRTGERGAAAV